MIHHMKRKHRIQMLLDGFKNNECLEAGILPTKVTGKSISLAWQHNLGDVILGTSFSFELSEKIITKPRNPDETEEIMALDSSKDAFSYGVSTQYVKMESRTF